MNLYQINILAKNSGYAIAFVAGAQYLGLIPASIVILLMFIATDIITGIMKSVSLYGAESIKSSVFERGILAKALIILIPANVALAGKGIGIDLAFLAQGTITALILSEFYSILGNFYAIRTGIDRVEFDAVAYVVSQLKRFLKAWIITD